MSFKSPWDRIAEALPRVGESIAQGIFLAQQQRQQQEAQELAIQQAADQAAMADAQAQRNQAASQIGDLAQIAANLEAQGKSADAARVRARVSDLERIAAMPIATPDQANAFTSEWSAITSAERTSSTRTIPGGPAGSGQPGARAVGADRQQGGMTTQATRPLFRPSISVTEDTLGSPMEEATRGAGVSARATREEAEAEEASAEAEERAAAQREYVGRLANSYIEPARSLSVSMENPPPELRDALNTLESAMSPTSNLTAAEVQRAGMTVLAASREQIGDEEWASAAEAEAQRLMDSWGETVTSEQAIGQLAQFKNDGFWDSLSEPMQLALENEANRRYGFDPKALTAENIAFAEAALGMNSAVPLEEAGMDAWRMVASQVATIDSPISELSDEEVKREVRIGFETRRHDALTEREQNRRLNEIRLLDAEFKWAQAQRGEYGTAYENVMTFANNGFTDRIDRLESIKAGEVEPANEYERWLAENLDSTALSEARTVAERVIEDMETQDIARVIQGLQASDAAINYLSQFDPDDIYSLVEENPDVAEIIGEQGLSRALMQAERRVNAQRLEDAAARAESPEVQSAISTLEMASGNPAGIASARRVASGADRQQGGMREEVVSAGQGLTWDSVESALDTLVANDQMTEEYANIVYDSLFAQNRQAATEAERALAQAQMDRALYASGLYPDWSIQDFRTHTLNLESAAESVLQEASTPQVVERDEDGNPVEVTCYTTGEFGGQWSPNASCQVQKNEYLALQREIRTMSQTAAVSQGARNLPPGINIGKAGTLGIDVVDQVIRMDAANRPVSEINDFIDEQWSERERRVTPVDVRVQPSARLFEPESGAGVGINLLMDPRVQRIAELQQSSPFNREARREAEALREELMGETGVSFDKLNEYVTRVAQGERGSAPAGGEGGGAGSSGGGRGSGNAPSPGGGIAPEVDAVFSSLVQQESGGQQFASGGGLLESSAGALGVTQVMPETAVNPGFGITPLVSLSDRDRQRLNGLRATRDAALAEGNAGEADRRQEEINALIRPYMERVTQADFERYGREYLNMLYNRYDGNMELALAAYNAGPGAVDTALREGGPDWLTMLPSETQNYVPSILSMAGRM